MGGVLSCRSNEVMKCMNGYFCLDDQFCIVDKTLDGGPRWR